MRLILPGVCSLIISWNKDFLGKLEFIYLNLLQINLWGFTSNQRYSLEKLEEKYTKSSITRRLHCIYIFIP